MAYVNVAEWKTNQVCEWLKGLDNSVLPYVHSFMNHNVNGQQLLNLRPEDLEHLCVFKLGHQEIILEAVEYLRTFHYELDRENLQLLALRLSGQAHSLYNELSRQTDLSKPVTTQALSDVVAIIKAVKPLIRWLDRPPFSGHLEYNEKKAELLKLSLEMATCAQRDRFAEKPIEEIKTTCGQLAKLADYIIQDIADPMILQPASLDLATLKKKPGDDLGFCILPSFHGAHQVAEIKFGSAAHQCGKMEEGDEIVQVNYQTVVGWERKNVLELFRESPADVLLTLKRRPRHTKVYGQIYIKPYRLPSNKKTPYSMRWEHNLPSPRPELLTIPDFVMPLPKHTKKTATPKSSLLDTVSMLDTMTTDDSGSSSAGDDSDDGIEPRSAVRLYAAKPRNLVQRRATITGASPTAKHSRVNLEQFWRELKREHSTLSFQLRDKAASCAQGLNNVNATQQQQHHQSAPAPTSRSQTSMGVEQRASEGRKVKFQDSGDRSPLANGGPTSGSDRQHDANDSCNSNNSSHTSDETCESNIKTSNNKASKESLLQPKSCDSSKDNNEPPALPARVSPTATKERGRLDKSFSTPAYDLTESDDDFIERKFEAALDEHHKQQLKARAASGKNKTDSRLFDSVEDLEEHDRTTTSKSNLKDPNFDTKTIIGNVARKINDIEKNLHSRSTEHLSEKNSAKSSTTTSPIKANTNVHIKINDVDVNDNLDDLEADSGNITTDFDSDEESNFLSSDTCDTKSEATKPVASNESTADNSAELSRESSEDKSESTGSYMEANTSGSTDSSADVDVKKLPIDTDFIAKQDDVVSGQNDGMIEALAPNTQIHKNAFVENISAKYPTSPVLSSPGSSLSRPNTPKRDVTKPEVKPRLTPPEPPPRKYFAKPAPLNFNVGQEQPPGNLSPRDHQQEKPRVPERPSVRQELKKPDVVPEALPRNDNVPKVQPRSENVLIETHRRKNERLETYSDFVEKSTDFIDEPSMSMQHEPNKTSNSFMDPYGYTEIPDDQEPAPRDKPLSPVIVTSHATVEHSRPKDHPVSQNIDAADGLCYSRQTQATPVENKPRSLEKDKSYERGMINRAMMVARSMGLHGNSSKASNSPRSVRKQTTNIAKRRNVAVKDVTPGDLEGYLIYRSRGAGGAWNKAWFILKGSSLYRFKAQDSTKADCLIALLGFTAAPATEVKSRKYAFKVYYTGTVFYFAADTEDTLTLWLETINRVTLHAERTSGLFSETDESDGENKSKTESSVTESKPLAEKTFNSLKKLGKKDTSVKDHELNGASLDRKYLKFLGSRTQNVPVPTAQFRSYRRVLPTSTPHRKPEKMSSPDLQVTIAGSTFYGLNSSQSATDVLSSSHDMGDYRRTTERLRSNRNQRPEEFQGFMTLEEFMLSRQEEECQRSTGNSFNSTSNNNTSPARFHTPLNNDHVHLQHSNTSEGFTTSSTNGMIYGSPRNIEDASVIPTEPAPPTPTRSDLVASSNHSFDGSETSSGRSDSLKSKGHKKSWEPSCLQKKKPSTNNNYEGHRPYSPTPAQREVVHSQMNAVSDNRIGYNTLDYGERLKPQAWYRTIDACNANVDFPQASRRPLRNDGYLSSSSDLACQACAETTLQRTRKEAALGRNGSFNMADRRRPDRSLSEEDWSLETARYDEHMRAGDNRRGQSNNIQHQPPIVAPSMSLHQGVMRPAFEMHFDQQLQQPASPKKKGLRNLFGKSSPKSSRSDPSREQTQKKTLLGSPSLRRAFFRDKTRNRSTNHNATENEIGQSSYIVTSQNSNFYPNYNSMNPTVNNVEMPPIFHPSRYPMDEAFPHYHNNPNPIPQWPSPPPPNTGPGILPSDYPPIFEPETYTFSNPSLRRQRSTKNNEDRETRQ